MNRSLKTEDLIRSIKNSSLWLVRHGETDYNVEKKYMGQTDIPLNTRGMKQASALGQALVEGLPPRFFSAVYSSDLQRAHQTAEAIAAKINLPIYADSRLKERHVGILSGLFKAEAERRYPNISQRMMRADNNHDVPGVELWTTFKARVIDVLHEMITKHPDEHIIVVTHGHVLCSLYEIFTDRAHHSDPNFIKPENTDICVVTFAQNAWKIEAWAKKLHDE